MDSDDEYQAAKRGPKRNVKRPRRELHPPSPAQPEDADTLLLKQAKSFAQSARSFDPSSVLADLELGVFGFETILPPVAGEYSRARHRVESAHATRNDHGHVVRPISRLEADQLVWELAQKQGPQITSLSRQQPIDLWHVEQLPPRLGSAPVPNQAQLAEPLSSLVETQPAPPGVLEELCAVKSTPFDQLGDKVTMDGADGGCDGSPPYLPTPRVQ
ncbi:hypothetical protein FRC06_004227 [Ceratobasidium sp. 370]|nr:hypothetical protein FRC06_004227 [Ceratobasidium sp. 370]